MCDMKLRNRERRGKKFFAVLKFFFYSDEALNKTPLYLQPCFELPKKPLVLKTWQILHKPRVCEASTSSDFSSLSLMSHNIDTFSPLPFVTWKFLSFTFRSSLYHQFCEMGANRRWLPPNYVFQLPIRRQKWKSLMDGNGEAPKGEARRMDSMGARKLFLSVY